MGIFEKLFKNIRQMISSDQKSTEEDMFSLTIAEDEIECSAKKIANLVSDSFTSRVTAMQFVLEELDLAQNGGTMEKIFVVNSGVEYNLYHDSIANLNKKNRVKLEEVDDAGKQLSDLLNILKGSKSFKIKFRLATLDKIMRKYTIGKYELKDSHEKTTAATKDA